MIKKVVESLKTEGFFKTVIKIFKDISGRFRSFRSNFIYFFYKLKAKNGEYLKTIQGSKMLLVTKDVGISKELIMKGIHEKNSTEFYKKTIKPGMHIGEFGANIGYYALLASKLLENNGFVYAFEPSPENFKQLKRNIELNNCSQLFELQNIGLGAENTEMKFYISTKGNMSSFIERAESGDIKNIEVLKVQVLKADEYFKNKKLDFVRMDVEGFEIEIIAGMHEILSRTDKPKGLFIEVHSELLHKRNGSARQFIENLCSYGYEVEKGFYRGKSEISVNSTTDLLNHNLLEKGYWETFFKKLTK